MNVWRSAVTTIAFIVCFASLAWPQSPQRMAPSQRFAMGSSPRVRLGPISDDERDRPAIRPNLVRVAMSRQFPADTIAQGTWQSTTDGTAVWRVSLQSKNALGMRVHFESFHAGQGQVWIHDTAAPAGQVFGPYSADGQNKDGDFWTEIVFSDTVEIEYRPADNKLHGPVPFSVREVSHLWRLGPYKAPRNVVAADAQRPADDFPVAQTAANTSCFLDATCYENRPDVKMAASASAFLIINDHSCSGVMLNAPNRFPLMLTAGHCVQDASEARQLIGLFNFKTQMCGADANALPTAELVRSLPQVSGLDLLAASDRPFINFRDPDARNNLDYALVWLSSFPPEQFLQSGYSIDPLATGEPVTSVSFPRSSFMKVAFGSIANSPQTDPTNILQNAWQVDQTSSGRIDGGSSGSGIFDSSNRLVGILSSSEARCPNPTGAGCPPDLTSCDVGGNFSTWYTKFSAIYPLIQNYLVMPITAATLPANQATFIYFPNPVVLSGGSTRAQITLNWDATSNPAVTATEIRVGRPSGALFARGNARGTAVTGNWVTNNSVFFLHNISGGQTATFSNLLATATVSFGSNTPTIDAATPFYANPNSLSLPDGAFGRTTLTWNVPSARLVEVRVNSPSGPLFASGGSWGSASTGNWVKPGMMFYLMNTSLDFNGSDRVISQLTIGAGQDGGGLVSGGRASMIATPNPIFARQGGLGSTTLNWNAVGAANMVEIHVGSPSGPLFARGGAVGSSTTGEWVTKGLVFYLQDVSEGRELTQANTLTTLTASVIE